MLLYDIPLIKQSLSLKCIGGLFTRTRIPESFDSKSQQWIPKINLEVIVAKTTSFQIYKYRKSLKADKIDMELITSVEVYAQICNLQSCSVRISQSKQYLDLVIVTLNTGQLFVYYYAKQQRKFICTYRDFIFKSKNQSPNFENPRNVGNYITCSQQNHFLITSLRCHKKLYQAHATQYEGRIKVNIKSHDLHTKENSICWSIIWLPSMSNQIQYYGKYVSIQKEVITLSKQITEQGMIDQNQQRKFQNPRKLKYYYVDKLMKINEKQQKKQGFKKLQQSAHMLIPVSSSSFFILYQNSIYLRELSSDSSKQQFKEDIIDTRFPIRQALVDKSIQCMFACYSKLTLDSNRHRIYLMNQFGDLFQIQYNLTGNLIANLILRYINSLKTVHSIIYVTEFQNSQIKFGQVEPFKFKYESSSSLVLFGLERFSVSLYFIYPLKINESKPKQTKVAIRPLGKNKPNKTYPQYSDTQSYRPIVERARDLQLSDQIEHMGAIIDTKVANLRSSFGQQIKEKHKQQNNEIFVLSNGGNLRHEQHIDQTIDSIQTHKSYLKIIRKGLKIRQVNSVEFIRPNQIYCFKKAQKEQCHKLVVICTHGKTQIYSVNNQSNLVHYRQLTFDQESPTIYFGKLQDESFIQVMSLRFRFIKKQKSLSKQFQLKNKVVFAVCLARQVFIGLFGGQIIFYQLERQKDALQFRKEFYVDDQIVSIQLTPIQINKIQNGGQKRSSRYLLVSTRNYNFLIYKMTPKSQKQTSFERISLENLKSPIHSIAVSIVTSEQITTVLQKSYIVLLGMENGTIIRMQFDKNMKKINHKLQQIGSKPVKIKRTSIGSKRQDSFLITTDKTYVSYVHKHKYITSLLAYPNIQLAAQMKQPDNLNTLMTFGDNNLRILAIQSFGQDFHDQRVDLFFSGKKLLVFENYIGIIQADPSYEKISKNKQENDIDIESNIIQIENLQKSWKSQFTVYKVTDAKKISAIYFDQTKQICLSAAYNSIKNGPQKGNYLIFGCAEGISYYPKFEAKQQTIKIYSWIARQKKENQKENQYKTQFLYSLNIDAIPLVIEPFFKGEKFLAGIGKTLKLYEIGRKKLLMKAELKNLPSNINQIKTIGKKIFVTSVSDSFHLFKYIPEEHTFYDIAEDLLPKFITAMNVLDSETVCAGDKFGNLFIGRLTENAKTQFQNASGSTKPLSSGNLYKFNTLAKINVGQVVTSINKVCLYTSKVEVILYSTIMGQLRVLYPLTELQQVRALPLLEQKICKKLKIEIHEGNSNWGTSNKVINGELVEKFLSMSDNQQKQIVRQTKIIDQSYIQYLKQMIESIRNRII